MDAAAEIMNRHGAVQIEESSGPEPHLPHTVRESMTPISNPPVMAGGSARRVAAFLFGNSRSVIVMIQSVYQGIEIEMEMHQQAHGYWKCDYTLIKHPERTITIHHVDEEFPTMDLAREHALHDARISIDQTGKMKGKEHMSETNRL